jgi:hypothetical protein
LFTAGQASNYSIIYQEGDLTVNPQIIAYSCKNDDPCQQNSAQVIIQVSGGTAPFTVTASGTYQSPHPGAGTSVPAISPQSGISTSAIFNGLPGNASYIFSVTDSNNCTPQN